MKRVGSCFRCGHCCTAIYLQLGMGHASTEEEHRAAEDFLRYAGLHENVVVKRLDENMAEVGYLSPCKHLNYNDNHEASCAIYADRPEICKRYPDQPNPNCSGFRFVE